MRLVNGKVVLLGAEGVGKTSLMLRMVERQPLTPHPTVGAAFFTFKMKIGSFLVNLQVWDTAGQERFSPMAPLYYRNANAALVVYDVTNFDSFTAAQRWIDELVVALGADLVLVVVGNKSDLAGSRAVPEAMARTLTAARGGHYYETSARQNSGVDDVFYHTALQLGQRLQCATGRGPTSGTGCSSASRGLMSGPPAQSYGTLSVSGASYRTVDTGLLRLHAGDCCY